MAVDIKISSLPAIIRNYAINGYGISRSNSRNFYLFYDWFKFWFFFFFCFHLPQLYTISISWKKFHALRATKKSNHSCKTIHSEALSTPADDSILHSKSPWGSRMTSSLGMGEEIKILPRDFLAAVFLYLFFSWNPSLFFIIYIPPVSLSFSVSLASST